MVQMIFNKIVSTRRNTFYNKCVYKLLFYLRKCILLFHDPLVRYNIGAHNILLPFSHDLPLILNHYPTHSHNLGRISSLIKEKYPKLSIIDIGANVGDSTLLLRNYLNNPILCIEGNKKYYDILTINVNTYNNITTDESFVGFESKIIKGESKIGRGTSFIIKSNQDIKIKSLPEILKRHHSFMNSKLIKIDTDGYDGHILRGALDILGTIKPVLFFEYDPFLYQKQDFDAHSLFQHLKSIGYRKMMVYDNFGKLMISIDMHDSELVNEIHNYVSGRNGDYYYDLCIFHEEDSDLYEIIRKSEAEFYNKYNLSI